MGEHLKSPLRVLEWHPGDLVPTCGTCWGLELLLPLPWGSTWPAVIWDPLSQRFQGDSLLPSTPPQDAKDGRLFNEQNFFQRAAKLSQGTQRGAGEGQAWR